MNNSTRTEELIRYLDKDMNEAERAALESQLEADEQAVQELERLRIARNLVQGYALRQQVYDVHSDMMKELRPTSPAPTMEVPVRSIFRYAMRIAASVLLIISVTAIYQYMTLSPARVFSDIYTPYESATTRGAASSTLQSLFNEKNYNEFINRFEAIPDHTTEDWFLAGNAYLQPDRLPQAINSFRQVQLTNRAAGTLLFEDDAEYYLAMALLKNNEPALALPLLETIHDNRDHPYHDQVSAWELTKVRWLKP